MIVKMNGAVLPTQTIALKALSLQTLNKMTGAVEYRKAIALMITTATKTIKQVKAIQTRTKKTTTCPSSFTT